MHDTMINDRIRKIRDKYKYIEVLTENYLQDQTDTLLDNLLMERENLLNEIIQERVLIERQKNGQSMKSYNPAMYNEIESIIKRVLSADSLIENQIRQRQQQVLTELNSLYGTSRAARAYTNHSAF